MTLLPFLSVLILGAGPLPSDAVFVCPLAASGADPHDAAVVEAALCKAIQAQTGRVRVGCRNVEAALAQETAMLLGMPPPPEDPGKVNVCADSVALVSQDVAGKVQWTVAGELAIDGAHGYVASLWVADGQGKALGKHQQARGKTLGAVVKALPAVSRRLLAQVRSAAKAQP